ncbi:MAG: hypothetical protein ACKO6Q_01705 [Bacteroidota bacterium]
MRYLLILILFVGADAAAQTAPVRPKLIVNPNPNPTRWNINIQFTDVQGRPFANLYDGIEGSAYFLPDFRWGQLETKTGKAFDSVQLSLDLYHHELHVIRQGKEIVTQDGSIQWVSIRDTVEGSPAEYVFQTGFPAIDKNPPSHFYQVLSAGTFSLLLHRKMELEKISDVMSGTTHERFVPVEQLYAYDGTEIRRLDRDLKCLEALFQTQKGAYQDYLRTHKVSMKNRTQLVQLFEAMNAVGKKGF